MTFPAVVIYEDRPAAFAGVELLVRSLSRHVDGPSILVYSPSAELAHKLADVAGLQWRPTEDLVGQGWNVKPAVLIRALEEYDTVCWLDSDIIVTGNVDDNLSRFSEETIVVGQEFHVDGAQGGKLRAVGHGLTAGRVLPYHVNSGTLRLSRKHLPLLTTWSSLLLSERYRSAQALPIHQRPTEYVSDQDVLWAVLVSDQFAHIPVGFLMNGRDMIQHSGANGYHVRDRVDVLRGNRPTLVHMLGPYKPWSFVEIPHALSRPRDYLHLLAYELSPFFEAALPYAHYLSNPPWLRRRTWPARTLKWVFGGKVELQGMPLALGAWFLEMLRGKSTH